jgi:hypothetical protein
MGMMCKKCHGKGSLRLYLQQHSWNRDGDNTVGITVVIT